MKELLVQTVNNLDIFKVRESWLIKPINLQFSVLRSFVGIVEPFILKAFQKSNLIFYQFENTILKLVSFEIDRVSGYFLIVLIPLIQILSLRHFLNVVSLPKR